MAARDAPNEVSHGAGQRCLDADFHSATKESIVAASRVLVVGAGYAGVTATNLLAARSDATITVVNDRDRFQERMRNHQVAVGRQPRHRRLSDLLDTDRVQLLIDRVAHVDLDDQRVELVSGAQPIDFDILVYAVGSRADLDAAPGAAEHAAAVATLEDACAFHGRLREAGSIAVVGGGLTGIETVTELAEDRPDRTVRLVSRGTPGAMLNERGRAHLQRTFDRLGIEVTTDVEVVKVAADGLLLADGDHISADAVLWSTGFAVPPLARESGLGVDARGRVLVDPTLRSLSHPTVYAVGDAAAARTEEGDELRMGCGPGGIAAVIAGLAITDRLAGRTPRPLRYEDNAWHISLGRRDGIVQLGAGERARVITGRAAAFTKERVLRGSVWGLKHPSVGIFGAKRF